MVRVHLIRKNGLATSVTTLYPIERKRNTKAPMDLLILRVTMKKCRHITTNRIV